MPTIQVEKSSPAPAAGGNVPDGYCKWCWKIADLPSPQLLGLEPAVADIAIDFPENTDILDPAGLPDAVKKDPELGKISRVGNHVLVSMILTKDNDSLRICVIARCAGGRNGEMSLQLRQTGGDWVYLPIDDQKMGDPDTGRKKNRWIPGAIASRVSEWPESGDATPLVAGLAAKLTELYAQAAPRADRGGDMSHQLIAKLRDLLDGERENRPRRR
jgi:hypothetical protein